MKTRKLEEVEHRAMASFARLMTDICNLQPIQLKWRTKRKEDQETFVAPSQNDNSRRIEDAKEWEEKK